MLTLAPREEAHDSGLCAASAATRVRFANDLLNLTLASPQVNRQKSGKDAGVWMPKLDPKGFDEDRHPGQAEVWPEHRQEGEVRLGEGPGRGHPLSPW